MEMQNTNQAMGGENKPAVPEGNKNTNMQMFIFGLLGLLAVALIVAAGCGIYRAYAKVASDKFTLTVAKVLQLPALKVNGDRILYTDFADDLKAIRIMRDYDKANNGPGATLTDEQMTDQVLWRLANNVLVDKAAGQYGLKVEDKDVADLKTQMLAQFESPAAADAELQKRYGWTMNVYEKKVMRPYLMQSKLQEKLQGDQSLKDEIKAQAQAVLDEIKNGADFAQMAQKYGSDGTAAQGGDLGWFGKGEMVPEFETAVFSLKKGELDQQLVETSYGYHIIKVDDTRTTKTKDAKGKTVTAEEVKASHILFAFLDLTKYLEKMAKETDFHLYLNVHNPFTELNATTSAQ